MKPILIVYGTKEGQTRKIAQKMVETFSRHGVEAALISSKEVPSDISLNQFSGIILGASIHMGKHSKSWRKFAKRRATDIQQLPLALFTVCLSVLGKKEEDQKLVKSYEENISKETGLSPLLYRTFAGALHFSQYNWFIRRVMKNIAQKSGLDTDTSQDYEYTHWEEVEAFTVAFRKLVQERQPASTPSTH